MALIVIHPYTKLPLFHTQLSVKAKEAHFSTWYLLKRTSYSKSFSLSPLPLCQVSNITPAWLLNDSSCLSAQSQAPRKHQSCTTHLGFCIVTEMIVFPYDSAFYLVLSSVLPHLYFELAFLFMVR